MYTGSFTLGEIVTHIKPHKHQGEINVEHFLNYTP